MFWGECVNLSHFHYITMEVIYVDKHFLHISGVSYHHLVCPHRVSGVVFLSCISKWPVTLLRIQVNFLVINSSIFAETKSWTTWSGVSDCHCNVLSLFSTLFLILITWCWYHNVGNSVFYISAFSSCFLMFLQWILNI